MKEKKTMCERDAKENEWSRYMERGRMQTSINTSRKS
jgi:hypothetical protein